MTGEPPGSVPDRPEGRDLTAEELAWLAIVENYGERAVIEPDAPAAAPVEEPTEPASAPVEEPTAEEDEHYVPPAPPPLPTPTPARLLAWLGLFGVPLFVLVVMVFRIQLPGWLGLLLMAWFIGGFVFLVATMRPRDDGYDDGAVV